MATRLQNDRPFVDQEGAAKPMTARLGLLFSDGSISVLPEGSDLHTAQKEAEEHDGSDPDSATVVIEVNIDIIRTQKICRRVGERALSNT
jgi:hypothetical protein